MNDVSVFNKGQLAFHIRREDLNVPKDAIMSTLSVHIDDEDVNVLYIQELDYGIVISESLVLKMKNIHRE